MYLLYTDETNLDPASSEFFVYGGVSIPSNHGLALSQAIDSIRTKYRYASSDYIKFNTRERPAHITPDDHRNLKKEVLEAAAKHGVKLFLSFILHRIATSPDDARKKEINRICYNFDCYLKNKGEVGMVLVDTFQDSQLREILCEKFNVGITGLPYSKKLRLERVVGFHWCCIGTSNYTTVVDVALGSIRFVVNNFHNDQKKSICKTLLDQMTPMFDVSDSSSLVSELQICFSPKVVKVPTYLATYKSLYDFLTECGLKPSQEPSSARTY